MARATATAVAIGECMLELRHRSELELDLGFAGDTYNTAVYLRRTAALLGVPLEVGYLSGLGDDGYSEILRSAWAAEGVVDRSVVVPGRSPGLYIVRTDGVGERSFSYWRKGSAASELFRDVRWVTAVEADIVHVSGVTLQLLSPEVRTALVSRLHDLRAGGARVSLDTNYRPAGWSSPAEAGAAMLELAGVCDVVLATWEDEQAVHGDVEMRDAAQRYRDAGAAEVVVRHGADGAYVLEGVDLRHVPAYRVDRVVDTTGAGDSFAGAYLAARHAGRTPLESARVAADVAAVVVAHPGAIVPADLFRDEVVRRDLRLSGEAAARP